jgi:hypothetical protein
MRPSALFGSTPGVLSLENHELIVCKGVEPESAGRRGWAAPSGTGKADGKLCGRTQMLGQLTLLGMHPSKRTHYADYPNQFGGCRGRPPKNFRSRLEACPEVSIHGGGHRQQAARLAGDSRWLRGLGELGATERPSLSAEAGARQRDWAPGKVSRATVHGWWMSGLARRRQTFIRQSKLARGRARSHRSLDHP